MEGIGLVAIKHLPYIHVEMVTAITLFMITDALQVVVQSCLTTRWTSDAGVRYSVRPKYNRSQNIDFYLLSLDFINSCIKWISLGSFNNLTKRFLV